jgi:hypothetical protein
MSDSLVDRDSEGQAMSRIVAALLSRCAADLQRSQLLCLRTYSMSVTRHFSPITTRNEKTDLRILAQIALVQRLYLLSC